MKKLLIVKVDNYLYTLKDNNNNLYNLTLEFHDINEEPKENDTIYMSDSLLNQDYKEYSDFYTFGKLDSKYGRIVESENNPDIIKIEVNNKSLYLKRLYG